MMDEAERKEMTDEIGRQAVHEMDRRNIEIMIEIIEADYAELVRTSRPGIVVVLRHRR